MKILSALSILVVVLLMTTACSKEVRINRKLEGSWLLQSVNGADLPSESGITYRKYSFSPDEKENGEVSIRTETWNGGDYSFYGNYVLSGKNKLDLELRDQSGYPLTIRYEVKSFSKKAIILIDPSGQENLLRPE